MNVELRLAKLERTSRYSRFAAVALGLTLVAITAMGFAKDADKIPDVIRARRFEVVNEQGTPQVSLWHVRDGGAIATHNSQGEARAGMMALDEGGGIATFDAKGRKAVVIATTEELGGTIITYDGEGGKLVSIGVTEGGQGIVATFDGKGGKLVRIGTTVGGEGAIATFNRAGEVRAQWP